MKKIKFDAVLDMDSKDFAKDLVKAMDLKEGEKVEFITPQFERTDGRMVSYRPDTPEEYKALPKLSKESLKKIGCQVWDEVDNGLHWLYPKEWYDSIPEGTEIACIMGGIEKFKRGETDDDIRFGALGYGFIQEN